MDTKAKLINPAKYVVILSSLITLSILLSPADAQDKITKVNTITTQTSNINRTIHAIGSITAPKMTNVSASVAGHITRIIVNNGQRVKSGDLLIQLDQREAQDALNKAKAQYLNSKLAFKRSKQLITNYTIAQQDFDTNQANFERDQADLNQAQHLFNDHQVKAPFAGTVGKITVSVGDYVTPGQALVPLINLNHLRVDYSLSENQANRIHLGDTVHITTPMLPGQSLLGRLSFISPSIDTATRTIDIQATLQTPLPDALRPGLFVTITQDIPNHTSTIWVPEQAIVIHDKQDTLFLAKQGKAKQVIVTAGKHQNGQVAIIKGIKSGDQIIVAGQSTLEDGQTIQADPVR